MDTTPPMPLGARPPGRDTARATGPYMPALARRRRVVLAVLALLMDGLASGPATGSVAGPLGALALTACAIGAAELARRLDCRASLAWAAGLTALVSGLFLTPASRGSAALALGAAVLLVRARQSHHGARCVRRRGVALACLAAACLLSPAGSWLVGLTGLIALVLPAPPSRPGGGLPRRHAHTVPHPTSPRALHD